jgi:excisionase family DNA binding protein
LGEKAVKIKEAAQMLGVCENTVRRLIIRNKLRRVPGLRHILIPVSEIDRFLSVSQVS